MANSILVDRVGAVGVVTLNKPEILNAWDKPMRDRLVGAFDAMEADPEIPVGRVTSLEQIVGSSISGLRSPIWMFLGFAATALLLATIGVYGLMRSACA